MLPTTPQWTAEHKNKNTYIKGKKKKTKKKDKKKKNQKVKK